MHERSGWGRDEWGKIIDVRRFFYSAETSLGTVYFEVPRNEMGENQFENTLPAQLLIRWLV